MSRRSDGEKTTATKAERRHDAAEDRAAAAPTAVNVRRADETGAYLDRTVARHGRNTGDN